MKSSNWTLVPPLLFHVMNNLELIHECIWTWAYVWNIVTIDIITVIQPKFLSKNSWSTSMYSDQSLLLWYKQHNFSCHVPPYRTGKIWWMWLLHHISSCSLTLWLPSSYIMNSHSQYVLHVQTFIMHVWLSLPVELIVMSRPSSCASCALPFLPATCINELLKTLPLVIQLSRLRLDFLETTVIWCKEGWLQIALHSQAETTLTIGHIAIICCTALMSQVSFGKK